ncbi:MULTISPECIES: PEP-CTERM sorting domain-containing protein [unclassified Massilia]|uniref:PEP-CTERM sorting domain-containing protein n=1 Tax=unclassified Massilia TaxID=2609279 RepID=UPI001782423B|nr:MULTISPECIES: PEP-CTERM sorting domain-containing protein [unclassified Massilia]MBD8529473.1 PEP-CTERM sorting domain-containing protein [Massilia sp. CFBP 13647]MBD8672866.1 PEP-CTERM sorting domain-containing protein [Massilia sp. CFBP 13721]
MRFRRRLVAGAFAAIAACAAAYAVSLAMVPESTPVAAAPAAQEKLVATGSDVVPARRVYRYSVVPGGAANGAELAQAIRNDRVVAAHYAGFDVQRARAVTVAAPRAVHVSYRKGDTVYWTAKKTMLKAGETLLTDGHNDMRARCANRISDVPRFPVEAHGPSPESLDKVVDGHGIETEGEISYVDAPVPVRDQPDLPGQAFRPVWPDSDDPVPADPRRANPPLALERPPGLPWPAFGWPGVPPQSDETPQPPLLTFAAPPPLSGWVNVPPDPAPLVPQPDPGQPAPPPNPPLDLPPPPADVPEPGTLWLAAIALAAMLGLRRGRLVR